MKPILYDSLETEFTDNGLGKLSDAISCFVTEQKNGEYYLEMVYPIDGIHFSEIAGRSIILAKPNSTSELQPFRVYRITKQMSQKVKIYAAHVKKDLEGVPVSPFTANSASEAMNKLHTHAVLQSPFTFSTDKSTAAEMKVAVPTDIKKLLYGTQGGILDVYGGEYEFDRFNVILHRERGVDRGVSIRYGKNLTSLEQEENCSNVYTGVYPYYVGENENVFELPEKIVQAQGAFNFEKYKPVDFTAEWENTPTEEQLRSRAVQYMQDNKIGVPRVNLDVSFIQLEQTEEYKGKNLLERVSMGDTVSVDFSDINVSAKARVVATIYDVLLERYDSVSIGEPKSSIVDTVINQQQEIEQKPDLVDLSQDIANKLAAAMGMHGGTVRFLDTNGDGEIDELYISDDPDPEKAIKVWRFNYMGWAASKNGFFGPYDMGATLEDGLLANFVTAATLVAGTIKSKDGNFFADLDNGIVDIQGLKVTIDTPALKVSGSGDISAAGSLTAASGVQETSVSGGAVAFKRDGSEVAHLIATEYDGKSVLQLAMTLNGILFGTPSSPKLFVNNGLDPYGYTEHVIADYMRIRNNLYTNNSVMFSVPGTTTYAGSIEGLEAEDGGVGIYGDCLYVNRDSEIEGSLSVGSLYTKGEKNRIVQTDDYGYVSLYSAESTSPVFSDMGTVFLDENGYSEVHIDPVFAQTVDRSHQYWVFTSSGKVSKRTDYFTVAGDPGEAVDWIVYYRQLGFSDDRLARKPADIFSAAKSRRIRIDEAVFESEKMAVAITEEMADSYQDVAEAAAEEYLKNYEQEIYGYA